MLQNKSTIFSNVSVCCSFDIADITADVITVMYVRYEALRAEFMKTQIY